MIQLTDQDVTSSVSIQSPTIKRKEIELKIPIIELEYTTFKYVGSPIDKNFGERPVECTTFSNGKIEFRYKNRTPIIIDSTYEYQKQIEWFDSWSYWEKIYE